MRARGLAAFAGLAMGAACSPWMTGAHANELASTLEAAPPADASGGRAASKVLEFGDLPLMPGVLGMAPAPGEAAMDAQAMWITRGDDGVRVVLRGGVLAVIGEYRFEAQRAVVWMRGTIEGIELLACFEEVGGASQGATSVKGEWLAVRATLARDARTTLRADLIDDGAAMPTRDALLDGLIIRGEQELAKVLGRPADGAGHGDGGSPAKALPLARFEFEAPREGVRGKRWVATLPSRSPPREKRSAEVESGRVRATPDRPSQIAGLRGVAGEGGGARATDHGNGLGSRAGRDGADGSLPAVPVRQGQAARAPEGAIIPRLGMITIGAGQVSVLSAGLEGGADGASPGTGQTTQGGASTALIASGGVTILYRENASGRTLQLTAQRAVVFTTGSTSLDAMEVDAGDVRGIYLEGEVLATDGQYTLRSPQVYYDVANDRAMMLDAVFSTFDVGRGLPLYVRAEEVRQESSRQFSAKRATVTNSAFFDPELSIGARSMTITRDERGATDAGDARPGVGGQADAGVGVARSKIVAEHVVLRAGGVPVFYWPWFAGDPEQPLLQDLRFENRSGSGAAVRARWNALALFGLAPTQDVSAELLTDYYVERGVAVGGRVSWDTPRHRGGAFGYALPDDRGADLLKTGVERERDGDFRGILIAEDRFRVSRDWTILSELTTISDETLVDGFFEQAGETRREFASRVRGERTRDNTQLTIEGKGSFNDFLANEWLLQSQGFSVQKLPEVAYVRQSDDLLESSYPGMLTHSSEYRVGRYALAFDEIAAADRGLTTLALSQRALGVDPAQSPGDALRARGLTEDAFLRADTRHELVLDATTGPAEVTPFVVARGTYYDNDFEGFSRSAGGNDAVRLWSAAGVRVSSEASTIFDTIDSRVLDVHRLRHIIQPSATVWAAGTNIETTDLPAADVRVDSLGDGMAVRLGLAQVFQTKRGAPGRLHDVDLLKINTDVVFSSEDTPASTPIGRFFDARPEYSAFGDYFVGDASYRLTDAVSLAASTIYDFESHQQDMSTVGVLISHQPGFSTLADLRYINSQDSTVLSIWGSYDLTDKYNVQFSPSYDTGKGEIQSVWMRLNRRFTAFEAGLTITYDNIAGETGFGFVFVPYGARGGVGTDEASSIYGAGGL